MVGRPAEQRHRLPHLGPLEEAGGAADDVGDAAAGQGLLEGLGLGVDPEEDRDLRGGDAFAEQGRDGVADQLGLGHLVGRGDEPHRRARRPLGSQPHGERPRTRQHGVGGLDHLGGRAVVAGELDRRRPRELAGEVAEVVGVGAGEGVDRLGGVADDAELVAPPEPQVEQGGLERGDVLELVDDEPFVLGADLCGDPLLLGQHAGGEEQDVLHVHARLRALDLLVAAEEPADRLEVEPGDLTAPVGGDARVVVGSDVADLGPLDLGGQVAQQRLVGLDPQPARRPRHQRELGLGEGGQVAAVRRGPEPPQLAQSGAVEGAGLHPRRAEEAQPAAHLAGGARGEGDGEHLGRRVDALRHAVGDAVGDRAGLAGARAGEHPDRAAQRLGDLALLGVEVREQIGGVGHDRGTTPGQRSLTESTHSRRRKGQSSMSSVTMYTTPWCGYCHRLAGQLDREGITYDVVDIEQQPEAADDRRARQPRQPDRPDPGLRRRHGPDEPVRGAGQGEAGCAGVVGARATERRLRSAPVVATAAPAQPLACSPPTKPRAACRRTSAPRGSGRSRHRRAGRACRPRPRPASARG